MNISYCELRNKEVVNVSDGKNLGNIIDLIIDTCCGKIIGIIVPCSKNFFNFFKTNNELFIPYNRICKIGKDIVLVDIIMQENCNYCNDNNQSDIYTLNNNYTQEPQKFNIQNILNSIDNIDSK